VAANEAASLVCKAFCNIAQKNVNASHGINCCRAENTLPNKSCCLNVNRESHAIETE
jgi:hypothetical protein